MIKIEEISYSVEEQVILDRVDFTIDDCEKVALVGPNGAGKSTLVKILMKGIIPQNGRIIFPKSKPEIGYMPQQLEDLGELPKKTVLDFMLSGRKLDILLKRLEEKLEAMNKNNLSTNDAERLAVEYSEIHDEFIARDGYSAESELLEVLVGIDLSNIDLDQDVRSLSGGQKTRLAFARVLFSKPDLMILDEPTNHLDENTIDWVVQYLRSYKGTLLMVSHAPSVLDEIVSKVIYLDGTGLALVFKGNFSDFEKKKEALDKANQQLYEKQRKEEARLESFIRRWRGSTKKKVAQVRDREKKLERLQESMVEAPINHKQIKISFPIKMESVNKVLEVENVSKSYGKLKVLSNIFLTLNKGERMVIMGPNGAGKTTLLRLIAGLLVPDKGEISLGQRVDIGYYAQEHELLNPENTLLEELMSVSSLPQNKLRSILAHFLFPGNKVFTKVGALSLGERSRLALAKLVTSGHNFLVLDEPTNHLDFFAREKVKEALREYQGTILIISHDREFVKGIGAEKVLLLPENRFGYLEQIVKG